MEANPAILRNLGNFLHSRAGEIDGGKPITASNKLKIEDTRKMNPVTGKPLSDKLRKSISVDPSSIKEIIAHAKAKGIDPYTALAISYQETGIGTDGQGGFYHLNPDYFEHPFANPEQGVDNIVKQFKYAKDMQRKGVAPQGEASFLQGYNGYGKIKKGHADLEGATSIYGYPIPDEGLNLKKNPLYGQAVISLRDSILKQHPIIKQMVADTPAYSTSPLAAGQPNTTSLPTQIFQSMPLK